MNEYQDLCSAGTKRPKILLVYAKVGAAAKMSLNIPLSLLFLAEFLKDYHIAVYDERVDPYSEFVRLLDEKPLFVGFSIMTGIQIRNSLNLAEIVKQRGIPTVFGGVHASIFPEQTAEDPRVDYVIVGEGEAGIKYAAQRLEKGILPEKIIRKEPLSLDTVHYLPYSLVDIEKYTNAFTIPGRSLPFQFSRGCPFQCTFCSNPVLSKGKWRHMSVDVAVNHLNRLVDTYKLYGITFFDENITTNPKLFNELASKINNRFKWFVQSRSNLLLKYDLDYLEKMGAIGVSCGLESGSPDILEQVRKLETVNEYIEVNKRLSKTNLTVVYNFMMGFPNESLEDLKKTVALAVRMLEDNPNAQNNTFYLLTPYPGTEIGEKYLKDKMPKSLEEWSDFGRHNFTSSWYQKDKLEIFSRIYFSSKFVGRKLTRQFPDDSELLEFAESLTEKWKSFEFYNRDDWDEINGRGWSLLRKLFGQNAY
ncbi:MAG: B12-binding domain-containing radical SAM protein [Nanoarchaeota archaeon]|nr:B12-binding domain-containing radical SAM protein [Nanoarchaeota archaeon]